MINLEEILKMWAKDSEIDDVRLDDASKNSAKLHSKYLELLSISKLQLRRKDLEFKTLLKNKWLWYNGKLTKAEIDALGWEYDALNGLKILKGEMDYYYDSDKEIQESELKIQYIKTLIDTLKEIVDTLRWRHQTIGNMIKWKQFEAGN